jgi:hypothetical protein
LIGLHILIALNINTKKKRKRFTEEEKEKSKPWEEKKYQHNTGDRLQCPQACTLLQVTILKDPSSNGSATDIT